MAVAADAAPDEQAALQRLLTRQRCNATGELKIAERKGPTSTFDAGNKELKKVADAASPEGRLIELARGRSVELDRCTDKISPEGRTKDVEKLNACACGVVKRWSLPLKKDEPKATAKLPLAGAVVLPIAVEAGKLTSCGPVEGLAP
jgi:hypothetical protein